MGSAGDENDDEQENKLFMHARIDVYKSNLHIDELNLPLATSCSTTE